MSYHIAGLISAVLSTLSVLGLIAQNALLWRRRIHGSPAGQTPTAVLSINRFITSFIVFFALYFYGGMLDPFNHYLAWPRVLALVLVLLILFQIVWDRKNLSSGVAFWGCLGLFVASAVVIPAYRPLSNVHPAIMPVLMVATGLIYIQGGVWQIKAIRKARSVGGLSKQMHLLFVYKDISLAIFAFVMGAKAGWPVLMTCSIGLAVNLTTLWHFRWARKIASQQVHPATAEPVFKPA